MRRFGFFVALLFVSGLVPSPGARGQQPPPRASGEAISSSENLRQFSVKDRQGQNIGQINQVLVDVQQGKIGYVVTTSRQQGGQRFLIPWNALQSNPQQKSFTLQMNADQLQQAPTGDAQTVQDASQARQIDQFYGVSPQWEGMQGQQGRIKVLEDIKQFSLQDEQGQNLGRIDKVLVDVPRGRIGYILASSPQQPTQKRLIPWKAVTVDPPRQTLTLQITADRFRQAPAGDETMVQDIDKARRIHQFFGVSPYWEHGSRQPKQPPTQQQQ